MVPSAYTVCCLEVLSGRMLKSLINCIRVSRQIGFRQQLNLKNIKLSLTSIPLQLVLLKILNMLWKIK